MSIQALEYLHGKDVMEDYFQLCELEEELENIEWENNQHKYAEMHKAWKQYTQDVGLCYAWLENDYNQYPNDIDFASDYDSALAETFPSDKELCLLRKARQAAERKVSFKNCHKFFRMYNLNAVEQSIFWNEYWQHINP